MSFQIHVENKHAAVVGSPVIVCGNSGYIIDFTFDAEWTQGGIKTVRFVYLKSGAVAYTDVVMKNDTVEVPILSNTKEVRIGVFEGDLRTTTPAVIPCELSIRCGTGEPEDPTPSQYDQIMALLSNVPTGESDWNASEGEAGYIHNRTHYVDADGTVHKLDNKFIDAEWMATETLVESDIVVLPLRVVQVSSYSSLSGFQLKLESGIVYEVHWNGESYVCQAFGFDGGAHLGNPALLSGCNLPATEEPFIISNFGGTGGFIGQGSGSVQTVSVKITGEPVVSYAKIPVKYLPDEALMPFDFLVLPDGAGGYVTGVTEMEIGRAIMGYPVAARLPYPSTSQIMTLYMPLAAMIPCDKGMQYSFIQGTFQIVLDPNGDGTFSVVVIS